MYLSKSGPARYTATLEGWEWDLRRCDVLPEGDMDPDSEFEWSDESGSLAAPMPGKVIKINVRKGDKIEKGMVLMIIEAMKMENKIVASRAATVKEVEVRLNQMVDGGKKLILFE